jgi:hypothetical protein
MSVRTYEKLWVALDAVRRHQKAHNKAFAAFEDRKLDKIAIFQAYSNLRGEVLDDNKPRYVFIGGINSLPALINATVA